MIDPKGYPNLGFVGKKPPLNGVAGLFIKPGLGGLADISMPTVSDIANWSKAQWQSLLDGFASAEQSFNQMVSDLQWIVAYSTDQPTIDQANSALADMQSLQSQISAAVGYAQQISAWCATNLGFSLSNPIAFAAILAAVVAVLGATYIVSSKVQSYDEFVTNTKAAMVASGIPASDVATAIGSDGSGFGSVFGNISTLLVIGAICYVLYSEAKERGHI